MMYPPPPCIRNRRLASEVKPRSATQMTFDSTHCRRSCLTCRIRPESAVFPGQDQTRTGIPSRVTAIPTMTCGRSSRESLDLPWVAEPGLARDVLAAGGNALAAHVARNVLVCLFRLEIRGGRVEEEQVYFKIQKVGDLVVRLLGQVRLDRQELVHRPVAGVVGNLVEAVDVHVGAEPSPRRRAWRTRPAPGSRPARTGPARWSGSGLRPGSACPARQRLITLSRPSLRHSRSRACVPPTGREAVTDSSPGPAAASASAGSSSRDRAATRRLTWSLSISSSRPKLCRILVRDRCVSASHSLWASCR